MDVRNNQMTEGKGTCLNIVPLYPSYTEVPGIINVVVLYVRKLAVPTRLTRGKVLLGIRGGQRLLHSCINFSIFVGLRVHGQRLTYCETGFRHQGNMFNHIPSCGLLDRLHCIARANCTVCEFKPRWRSSVPACAVCAGSA